MRCGKLVLAFVGAMALATIVTGQDYPNFVEDDFVLRNFQFSTGETLPELRVHYRTLGKPQKDARGIVRNAVLIMHGTGGSGAGFLSTTFGGSLFRDGQLLDASQYFIILPDAIGHGKSSKPSDGLKAKFPRYTYDDMVSAQYRLVTEKLGVQHLRLVMGTSMGAMHTWVWGYTYPDFVDALMPLASLPVQIAGRNRMFRRMVIDSIRNDPEWMNGEYTKQPRGLQAAIHALMVMTSSPLQMQKQAPTRQAADQLFDQQVRSNLERYDANDMLYQFDSSRDYNPAPHLSRIKAPLIAVNSADDVVNPPELGLIDAEIRKVPRGRYILIPVSEKTRGHGTHSIPEVWQQHLADLLKVSASTY